MESLHQDMPAGQRLALERRAERVAALRGRLGVLLAGADAFTLEIGCGHGRWLAAYAEANPGELCIGIDIISRRLKLCENKKRRRGLGNAHFLKAEGGEFMEALPEGVRLAKTFVLFPDPWPKKRHHKNRLIQEGFLSGLAELSAEDGRLFFRTDHADYFAWAEEGIAAHPRWEVESTAPWPFEHSSWFQDLMGSYKSLVARRL